MIGIIFQVARNNPRHRLVPVTNQHFFARPDSPDMGAEASLQFGNVNRPHDMILAQHDYLGHDLAERKGPILTIAREAESLENVQLDAQVFLRILADRLHQIAGFNQHLVGVVIKRIVLE